MAWIHEYTPYWWDTPTVRKKAEYLFFKVYRAKRKGLLGAPRDAGKSKISTAIYACIMLNYYKTQMCIVGGVKGKIRIYSGMYRILTSDKVRLKYGDVMASNSKNLGVIDLKEELRVKGNSASDDPSFLITTVSGVAGAHPYICWLEDILQSEAKDEAVNEYLVEEIHNSIIMKLTRIIGGTYTRKSKTDLYSKLPELGYMMYVVKAIRKIKGSWPTEKHLIYEDVEIAPGLFQKIKVGCRIPEGSEFEIIDRPGEKPDDPWWDTSWLLLQRMLDEDSFEREMQNNPQPKTGHRFKKEWYEAALVDPEEEFAGNPDALLHLKDMIVDPAFGKSSARSDTAYILGALYNNTIYITEIVANDDDTFAIEDTIESLTILHNLQSKYIENDFSQISTRFDKDSRLFTDLDMDVFTNKGYGAKEVRIGTLAKPYRNKMIKVFNTCTDLDEFKDQFLSWRPDRPKWKWDILDGMASFIRIVQYGSGKNKYDRSVIYHA